MIKQINYLYSFGHSLVSNNKELSIISSIFFGYKSIIFIHIKTLLYSYILDTLDVWHSRGGSGASFSLIRTRPSPYPRVLTIKTYTLPAKNPHPTARTRYFCFFFFQLRNSVAQQSKQNQGNITTS